MQKYTLILLTLLSMRGTINAQQDEYQWLEEVDGEKALQFVEAQNKITIDKLSIEKDYQSIYDKTLEIYNSSDKIASPTIRGKYIYNFWKDKIHVRGIWRRCLLTDYINKDFKWEILLDIDDLSKNDNKKWVFKGANPLHPTYQKFLIELSNGGGDAVVVREFDVESRQFVEDGFYLEEAKSGVSYIDENTLCIGTDFGQGSLTESGYPNQVKIWKRGTALKDAKLIYSGDKEDVGTWGGILLDGDISYVYIQRAKTFFSSQKMIWLNNKIITLDIPEDCNLNGILNNQLIIQLKSDWAEGGKQFKTGSLLSLDFTSLLKGIKVVNLILEPNDASSINEVSITKNNLLVNVLNNVTSQLSLFTLSGRGWVSQKVKSPDFGTITIKASDELSDHYFFQYENFITPSTLYYGSANDNAIKPIKSLPAYFDGSKYQVNQYYAKSKDGTMVPYFMVSARDLKYDGTNPTLIYAYGGFEVSMQPFYAASFGVSWLDKGGVFVLANIRGGGEFGPNWHQSGIKDKRQNVFNDLYAVSEDVIQRKVTTPRHLGIEGGSNGGLLVGVAFTQRPDLYNAVVCAVPLLDMQRYNKLLAGASWMSEYGNPDIAEEWEYIKKYSPYHNLKKGAKYPEVFFTTSTRDDRVHPGHARKMVAKMNEMGYTTYYYENTEGGHAGSSTNEQSAKSNALMFSYLLNKLR